MGKINNCTCGRKNQASKKTTRARMIWDKYKQYGVEVIIPEILNEGYVI